MTDAELRSSIQGCKDIRLFLNRIDHQYALDTIVDLAERVLDAKVPEIKKAHTYSSENADVYRAYDACVILCFLVILSPWL